VEAEVASVVAVVSRRVAVAVWRSGRGRIMEAAAVVSRRVAVAA